MYHPHKHHARTFFYGTNSGGFALAHLAGSCGCSGIPTRPCNEEHEALTMAHAQGPLHAITLANVANLIRRRASAPRGSATAQERAELAKGARLRTWVSASWLEDDLPGLGARDTGAGEDGIEQMRQGLAACRATGAEIGRTYYLALLAEAYGKGGQPEEGLSVLAEAPAW